MRFPARATRASRAVASEKPTIGLGWRRRPVEVEQGQQAQEPVPAPRHEDRLGVRVAESSVRARPGDARPAPPETPRPGTARPGRSGADSGRRVAGRRLLARDAAPARKGRRCARGRRGQAAAATEAASRERRRRRRRLLTAPLPEAGISPLAPVSMRPLISSVPEWSPAPLRLPSLAIGSGTASPPAVTVGMLVVVGRAGRVVGAGVSAGGSGARGISTRGAWLGEIVRGRQRHLVRIAVPDRAHVHGGGHPTWPLRSRAPREHTTPPSRRRARAASRPAWAQRYGAAGYRPGPRCRTRP